MKDPRFASTIGEREKGLRTPIDQFLESLASTCGRSAFAVILSGTGSDGTLGVRAVKEAGGFAIVQQSESARFPGMPDSAAATGLVDLALKPKKIPQRLVDIVQHRRDMLDRKGADRIRADIEKALPDILDAIADKDGHDFSAYKPGTLVRRIERRLTVVREQDIWAFLERLRSSAEERGCLLQDFLIGVTKFFRDEDAFLRLKQEAVLPLLDRDQNAFRVWVPGCSTGEEAYSIAILFSEAMEAAKDNRQWQIFGTDIDASSLSHARAGIYSDSHLEGLSDERRERFFVKTDGNYQIHPQLRERCIFAPHNLLQDPPFSRLDIISCRNLLIYLSAAIQHTVIPKFHYGLNPGGFLLLGPSESLGKQERFFNTLDRETRLFKRNDDEELAFSSLTSAREDATRRERRISKSPAAAMSDMQPLESNFDHQLLNFFARRSAPPFVTVKANDEISYISERMGDYIRPSQGQPSMTIDQFLLRDLRLPVRSAIHQAREDGDSVTIKNVLVKDGVNAKVIDVEAVPLPFAEGTIMITLQPVRTQDAGELVDSAEARSYAERDMIERELAMTRQQLSSTLTSYETTEQELKSSNEELLSMNEELQSSNEELETSREELQSINEELETVNAELTENNRQLLLANSDLRNLFDSTDIAMVFLDQNLGVRRYTPASRRLFGIQDRDLGRSINDLKWKISYDDLENDAARVAESLQPIEREVRIEATGETFLMRIRPYRRTDDRIDGCVVAFIDITARKAAERQLQENAETLAKQYAELESLYDTTPVGLTLLNKDLRFLRINERLAAINGLAVDDHIGRRQDEVLPDIDSKIRAIQQRVLTTGEPSLGNEIQGVTPANPGVQRDWIADYYPVRTVDGEIFAVGCCVTEVTEQKQLYRELEKALGAVKESEARLNFALETSKLGAWELDIESGKAERTLLHDQIFGHDELLAEWSFDRFMTYVVGADRETVQGAFEEAMEAGGNWQFQCRIRRTDGDLRWIEAHGRPIKDASDCTFKLMGTVQDITVRKEAEEQQSLLLHELQHRVKNTMATTLAIVQFSAKRAVDVTSFTDTLRSRLQAIARTHDLLTTREWRGALLSDIVRQELMPYADRESGRVIYEGDAPRLSAKQILALTLAFHELATNAAKYGALSEPEGRVVITAEMLSDQQVRLVWRERNGPKVEPPDSMATGFGTFLLQRVLGPDLEGEALIDYHADGVEWRVTFPLDQSP